MPRIIVSPAFLGVALVAVTLTGLAIAAYAYMPKAEVIIAPPTYNKSTEREIILSTSLKEPDFVRFALPAKVIDKTVSEETSVNRSAGDIETDFARGTVTLFNKQDKEQPLLPKTHLRHEASGVFFLTDNAVRIPASGELAVGATAKEKGPAGNVPAGKFIVDKLPASMQAVVYGESKSVFTGGEVTNSPFAEQELVAAKKATRAKAEEKLKGELTAAVGGASLNEGLVKIEPQEESASAEPGSRTTTVLVKEVLRGRAFVLDEKDLLSFTLLSLRASPAPDEDFIAYDPASFSIELLQADFERGEARAKGRLTGTFAKKTSPALLDSENLAGRSAAEVKEFLQKHDGIGEVDVNFSPFWVKEVPSRPGATTIIIRELGARK